LLWGHDVPVPLICVTEAVYAGIFRKQFFLEGKNILPYQVILRLSGFDRET